MSCSENDPLKVAVPADFGVHRLGSPSHSNLKFHLKDGSDILANSIIISLNSPVIDHFTTDLSLQSIDVQDFERDAVQCFIDGCYEGKLKKLNKGILREVNKMSKVFEVSWMGNRCAEYFDTIVNSISSPIFSYDELFFVFDEAFYVMSKFQNKNLMDKVVLKFSCTPGYKQIFLENFMRTPSLDKKQLDLAISIAGRETEILVTCIIDLLEANGNVLGNTCRYLLQNLKLASCFRRKPDLQHRLIQSLDAIANPTAEDFRLVLSLFSSSTKKDEGLVRVSNLFNLPSSINSFTKFEDLVEFLSTSEKVSSLYMFIEGLLCWLFDRKEAKIYGNFIPEILSLKDKRKWNSVSNYYFENLPRDAGTVPLLKLIKENSSNLITTEGQLRLSSSQEWNLEDFLLQEQEIEFIIDNQNTTTIKPCSKEGRCGVIAKLTPCTPEDGSMFDIQFVLDPYEYPSNIHYCGGRFSIDSAFFALKCFRSSQNRWRYFPVSWSGKPEVSTDKTVWRWGANCFSDSSVNIVGKFEPYFRRHWLLSKNVKLLPELFVQVNN